MIDEQFAREKLIRLGGWLLFGLSLIFLVLSIIFFFVNRGTVVPPTWAGGAGTRDDLASLLNFLIQGVIYNVATPLIGAFIVAQRPQNPIGWLLSIVGLGFGMTNLMQELTVLTVFTSPLTLGPWIALIRNILWVVPIGLLVWIAAIFPNGRLLNHSWRWLLWLIILYFALMLITALSEPELSSAFFVENPINFPRQFAEAINFGIQIALILLFGSIIGVTVQMVLRFRRSHGVARQQVKWLVISIAFAAIATFIGGVTGIALGNPLGQALVSLGFVLPVLGIGMAILRYRLYDVDIIIRRTLVYSLLSAVLATIYFGSVLLIQSTITAFGGQQSAIVTVVSTLIIAALFNPLRQYIQAIIDKRFYRSKYDAQQTLAQFATTARDEVDLERLTAELVHVIQETMQPERVSLWLKPMLTPRRLENNLWIVDRD